MANERLNTVRGEGGPWPWNQNLLDNWCFIDPINQRGQKEYAGTIYCIDRWRSWGAENRTTINDGYITATRQFAQVIEPELSKTFNGRQMTLSLLTKEGDLYSTSDVVTLTPGTYSLIYRLREENGNYFLLWYDSSSMLSFQLNTKYPVNVVAIKLEFGSTQTLAHKEGSTWVLNDAPPNKALELLKCQRYFQRLRPGHASFCFGQFTAYSTTNAYGVIPLATSMRAKPVVSMSGTFQLLGGHTATISNVAGVMPGFVAIVLNSTGLTTGTTYYLENLGADSYIDINDDL